MNLSPLAKPSLVIPKLANLDSLYDFRATGANARGAIHCNSASSQSLSVASNTTIQAGDVDFWVAFWVFADTTTGFPCAASKWGEDGWEWALYLSSAAPVFHVGVNQTDFPSVTSSNTVVAGQWYFLLAWHDATNNTINIRVNDAATDSLAHSSGVYAGTAPLHIGSIVGSQYWNGRIDQVAFGKPSSVATTISDIHAALYNAGNGVSYSSISSAQKTDWGLVSFWELDELSGNRVDSHGTNHLSPQNGPTAVDGIVEGPADELDPVATWDSGATTLEQATIASRPTYRTTYVDFDGSDDQLSYGSTGGLIAVNQYFTHLLKVRADALPSASNESVLYCEEDASATVQYRVSINDAGNIVVKLKPSGATLSTITGSALSTATDYVIAIRRESTDLSIYIDGVLDQSGSCDSGTTMTGATTRLGAPVYTASSVNFDGRIYRMLVEDSALSTRKIKYYGQQL